MVEPSLPRSRVGAAAVPDSIFLTRQTIFNEVPGACSAVPHSPVSGNVSSTRGLPLAGPGIGSTPRLGGMSLKILFISSGSRCPVARAATSPSSTLQTVLLCILAVHIPLLVVVSGGSSGIPAVVSARRSSYRSAHRFLLPGGVPSPGTPFVANLGWPAPSRPVATGCWPWYWPLWTGHGAQGVRKCLIR